MSVLDDYYNLMFSLARQAARSIGKHYPMIDVEDLVQTALLWAAECDDELQEWIDEDRPWFDKTVLREMRNVCKQYARTEKAQQLGYEPDDEVFYSLGHLTGDSRQNAGGLLHYIFDRESWLQPPQRTGGRTLKDPAEGNDWVATLADVSRAVVKNLSIYDQWVLQLRFGPDRCTYDEIGQEHEPPIDKRTAQHRVEAAARRVQDALGGFKPHTLGDRKVISNAHARYITEKNYTGDPGSSPDNIWMK